MLHRDKQHPAWQLGGILGLLVSAIVTHSDSVMRLLSWQGGMDAMPTSRPGAKLAKPPDSVEAEWSIHQGRLQRERCVIGQILHIANNLVLGIGKYLSPDMEHPGCFETEVMAALGAISTNLDVPTLHTKSYSRSGLGKVARFVQDVQPLLATVRDQVEELYCAPEPVAEAGAKVNTAISTTFYIGLRTTGPRDETGTCEYFYQIQGAEMANSIHAALDYRVFKQEGEPKELDGRHYSFVVTPADKCNPVHRLRVIDMSVRRAQIEAIVGTDMLDPSDTFSWLSPLDVGRLYQATNQLEQKLRASEADRADLLEEEKPTESDQAGRPPLLTEKEQEVWDALEGRALTGKDLAKEVGSTDDRIRHVIAGMRKKGWPITTEGGIGYYRPDKLPPSPAP